MDVDQETADISPLPRDPQDAPEIAKAKKAPSAAFSTFSEELDAKADPEEKIRLCLAFMRTALSQQGSPHFEDFWEGRRVCLPLFKGALNAKSRALLWAEYIELSSEARRLKTLLDEQSAFAAEQIDLAIQGLEGDLSRYEGLLSQSQPLEIPESCQTLYKKRKFYQELQQELQILGALASRVNALRKEVIKTPMRIRYKTKFFERLSACGDQIFPKRKELIKKISDAFTADVIAFIDAHFGEEQEAGRSLPLFALREEIKDLQAIAKVLTLNTQSFTDTRLRLSKCWDSVKEQEKERKKEIAEKKGVHKENAEKVLEKIRPFAESIAAQSLSAEEAQKQLQEISDYMRDIELGRDEVRMLKDQLALARQPLVDREKQEQLERERKEQEMQKERREKLLALKARGEKLLEESESQDPDQLAQQWDLLSSEVAALSLSALDKQAFDRLWKKLKEVISDKKERALLNLSEDDLLALEKLKDLLEQRKQERLEVRAQLEQHRKALSGSGFDFEKAMLYRELIDAEKAHLDKATASIQEIEEKIAEIEG